MWTADKFIKMTGIIAAICLGFVSYALAAHEPHTVRDCPENVKDNQHGHLLAVFGESCYSFQIGKQMEFAEAEKECIDHGGHLVTIPNNDTQEFLYKTLKDDFGFSGVVWIGLSDKAREGEFLWIGLGTKATYTNWASGQPSTIFGRLEDCVGMDVGDNGGWNDYRCAGFLMVKSRHNFICEYPVQEHAIG